MLGENIHANSIAGLRIILYYYLCIRMAEASKRQRTTVKEDDDAVYPLTGLENLNSSVWLVKIPPYIAEQWANAKQDELLGSFHAAKTADGKRQFIVKLDNDRLTAANATAAATNKRSGYAMTGSSSSTAPVSASAIPKDLVIAEMPRPKNAEKESMITISSSDKKNFHIDNRITKRFIMRPQNRIELAAVMKERTMNDIAKKPVIEVREVDEVARAESNARTIGFATQDLTRATRQRGGGAVSEEMEDEIKRIVYPILREGFAKFLQLWEACKGIPGITQDLLKDALKEIAIYNNRGLNKFYYELPDEYRGIEG